MRVVLVDDNEGARRLVRRLLELTGGVEIVAEAGNGEEAIRACRRESPDIVIMDCQMPLMDGFAATRVLKSEDANIFVVMISSFGSAETRHRAEQAGADRFLDKEEVVGEICRVVAELGRERARSHLTVLPGESPPARGQVLNESSNQSLAD